MMCKVCATPIEMHGAGTYNGTWWAHVTHPDDAHAALPTPGPLLCPLDGGRLNVFDYPHGEIYSDQIRVECEDCAAVWDVDGDPIPPAPPVPAQPAVPTPLRHQMVAMTEVYQCIRCGYSEPREPGYPTDADGCIPGPFHPADARLEADPPAGRDTRGRSHLL